MKTVLPSESCTMSRSCAADIAYRPAGNGLSEIEKSNGTLTVIFACAETCKATNTTQMHNTASRSACFFILTTSSSFKCSAQAVANLAQTRWQDNGWNVARVGEECDWPRS